MIDELRELEAKVLGCDNDGYFWTVPPGVKVTLRLGFDGSFSDVILEKRAED